MKVRMLLVLIAFLLFVARVEAGGPGRFGGGRSQQFGHHAHGGFGARHFGSGYRSGGFGQHPFGGRYSGAFYRHQYFSPGFFAPYYWYSGYDTPVMEREILVPVMQQKSLQLYYRKAPALDMNTDCKDSWTENSPPNSVSQVMKRMFELQCENGHPLPDPELKHTRADSIEEGSSITPP
jgi:hypothetical protein